MNFEEIDELILLAQKPLSKELESINGEHHRYHRFLYHYIKTYKPKLSMEIGVWQGVGCRIMAEAAKEYGGIVIGIDINAVGLEEENIIFMHGSSVDQQIYNNVRDVVDKLGEIGLILQDSSHHYEPSCMEWNMYKPLCNGLWLCDDITPAFHDPKIDPPGKGMVEYFEERPGEKALYSELHQGNMMGVIL